MNTNKVVLVRLCMFYKLSFCSEFSLSTFTDNIKCKTETMGVPLPFLDWLEIAMVSYEVQ